MITDRFTVREGEWRVTIDELNVKINVAADEAIAALDELLKRIQSLTEAAGAGREIRLDVSGAREDMTSLEDGVRTAMDNVCEAIKAPEIAEAAETLRGYLDQALSGLCLVDEEDRERFTDAWETLLGEDSALIQALSAIPDMTGEAARGLMEVLSGVEGLGDSADSALDALNAAGEAVVSNANAMESAQDKTGEYGREIENLRKDSQALAREMGRVTEVNRNVTAFKNAKKAYDDARKSGKNVGEAFDGVKRAAAKLGKELNAGTGDVKAMDKAVAKADKSVDALAQAARADGNAIVATLQGMLVQAEQTEAALNIQATQHVDVSQPLSAIQAVIRIIRVLLSLMGAAGIAGKGGGGGGGGGGKKDTPVTDDYDAEEEARKAEEARKEGIRLAYEAIEHKRHMNEITLEEELAMLEKIRVAHQLNAEEIMEWEEKIYDLKQELRERDAESIDTLADGVVEALEKRYEAMRDAEIDRLDQSRKAWEQWRDDSVQAIEDQIDALDKLSDAEDNEAKDAEELRKIEKLRRETAYEQDEYNRAKLQQQLDNAIADREDRLRKLALKEQKEALREEIDRIENRTDEQLSALDKEQEAIEAAYAERLKTASIQAEAEKLLMSQNQDEIVNLLYEYVPEYDALGKTMGEKLLEGFQSKVGNIVDWFKSFNAELVGMQNQLASATNAAAESFYQGYASRLNGSGGGSAGVTVNQSVTFNEPVESPSQVARRMEDVNDALGELMG